MRSLVLPGLVAIVGCTPGSLPDRTADAKDAGAKATPPASDPDPAADPDPVADPDPSPLPDPNAPLRFVLTDFHFELGGTAVFDLEGRRVRDLFPDARQEQHRGEPVTVMFFRLAEYELTPAEATALREAVTAPDFWALDASYVDDSIQDGSSQDFIAIVGDVSHRVHAYQRWPPPLTTIKERVRAIQAAHDPERAAAKEIDPADADEIRAAVRTLGTK